MLLLAACGGEEAAGLSRLEEKCRELTDIHPEWDRGQRKWQFKRCLDLGPEEFARDIEPFDPTKKTAAELKAERDAVRVCHDAVREKVQAPRNLGFPEKPSILASEGRIFVKGNVALPAGEKQPIPNKYLCMVVKNKVVSVSALPDLHAGGRESGGRESGSAQW